MSAGAGKKPPVWSAAQKPLGIAGGSAPGGSRYRGGSISGARLLISDWGMVYLLLREARNRAVQQVFGVTERELSFLVAMLALGALMRGASARAERIPKPSRVSLPDAMIGAALVKETVYGIGGDTSRDSEFFASLIGFALIGAALRPVARSSVHGVRRATHTARVEFVRRYGQVLRRARRSDS
jgi:hypothetical protein